MSRRRQRSTSWSALASSGWCLWRRGVDSSLFRPDRPGRLDVRRALGWAPEDVVITYVSRIAPEKNVDYLADALAIVASRRPDVRLLLVGDGPSRPALEQRIGSIAHFAGYLQGEALCPITMRPPTSLLSPSLTETFGNVVLEAMASGLPVVALRAGGVGESVQSGTTGILVDPSEPPVELRLGPPAVDRAPGRADRDGTRRQGICPFPELGRDHGRPARALSARHRRAGPHAHGSVGRALNGRRCRQRGALEPAESVAPDPQARRHPRRQIMRVQERSKCPKRSIAREDQLGGLALQGRHDLLGSRFDQRMVAIGLIAEQVVDEEMACRAVQMRVEVERALPAPDVKPGMVLRSQLRRAISRPMSRKTTHCRPPLYRMVSSWGEHEQVVADLEERRSRRCPMSGTKT